MTLTDDEEDTETAMTACSSNLSLTDQEEETRVLTTSASNSTLLVENTDSATISTPSSSRSTSTSHYSCEIRGKRKIGYNPEWEKEWPWLQFRDGEGMFCSLCTKYAAIAHNKSGIWVNEPCTQFRKDKVKKHSDSEMHKGAQKQEDLGALVSAHVGIVQAFEQTWSVKRQAVDGALKILYWLAKNEVAHFTKFDSLKQLYIDLGCTYLKELNLSRNANYSSQRVISEWLDIMSQVLEEAVLKKVWASPAIGLTIDESTDISLTKELIVYARILCSGVVYVCFLKIIQISDGTADTIVKAILSYLEQAGITVSRITSFGSDGVAVMTGSVGGVATRFKQLNPEVISVPCINHRPALGVSQEADTVPYLKKFAEILTAIFIFYHKSVVRQQGLEEIQSILEDPTLKFKLPSATRWLSRAQTIDAVRRSLSSLLVSLDREASERADATAVGLVTLCRNYMFVATII